MTLLCIRSFCKFFVNEEREMYGNMVNALLLFLESFDDASCKGKLFGCLQMAISFDNTHERTTNNSPQYSICVGFSCGLFVNRIGGGVRI